MKPEYAFPIQVSEKARSLGYAPEKQPLLFLVPLVKVAWADSSFLINF